MTAEQEKKETNTAIYFISGVAFTFFLAFLGFMLAKVPGFTYVGPLGCAIVIAVIYRQFFGYPFKIKSGITFSSKILLRLAIILYGLRLNINTVINDGLALLIRDAFVIIFAILLMIWLAKVIKADGTISLLAGVGTGVCGAAAIAAVAPIVKAKDEDTAISIGMIALIGTIFSIIYTMIRPILPYSDLDYGIWSGISLHELAHVALAATPAGQDALAIALLAKLGRVFLLIPLCFILIYFMKRKNKSKEKVQVPFPMFLLGFILCSMLGTYILGPVIPFSETAKECVYTFTTWLLTAAMVGLGLSVSLSDLRNRAMKPFIAVIITSFLLSVVTYFIV